MADINEDRDWETIAVGPDLPATSTPVETKGYERINQALAQVDTLRFQLYSTGLVIWMCAVVILSRSAKGITAAVALLLCFAGLAFFAWAESFIRSEFGWAFNLMTIAQLLK